MSVKLTGLIVSYDSDYQEITNVPLDSLEELVKRFEEYHFLASEEHRAIVKNTFIILKDGVVVGKIEKY
ncbi:MAG: hypothetical protein GF308_08115 [Candidatus Heimdallarchaeota archaeon]|nr:hypothetical protein [Candidatus Heimdallarchaeota archaeon]